MEKTLDQWVEELSKNEALLKLVFYNQFALAIKNEELLAEMQKRARKADQDVLGDMVAFKAIHAGRVFTLP